MDTGPSNRRTPILNKAKPPCLYGSEHFGSKKSCPRIMATTSLATHFIRRVVIPQKGEMEYT